jgi:hypothetical protein
MKWQWPRMRQVAVPASTPAAEEDIDHRPSWEPTPPTVTREWSRSISSMKHKVTTLTEVKEAALFRASKFPSVLLHVETNLKGEKPFKDSVLQTRMTGACGLALVRCGELAFSSLGGSRPSYRASTTPSQVTFPKTWTPSSKSLGTLREAPSTSARASGRSPTSCPGVLSPFPNSSLWRQCQDSRGLGGGREKAVSGRLLPFWA